MAGMPVMKNADLREGEFSFDKCFEKYQSAIRCGRHRLLSADYARTNAMVGSVFFLPIFVIHCKKQNNGIMHTGQGHIIHFWLEVSRVITRRMSGCRWQLRIAAIRGEVEERMAAVDARIKRLRNAPAAKARQNKMMVLQKQINKTNHLLKKSLLQEERDELAEECRDQSQKGT